MPTRSVIGALALALLVSCVADDAPTLVGSAEEPIVDGDLAHGRYPGVVFLYNLAGAACTGSLIAPRVVLTAKHCVQGGSASAAPASQFRVYVGDSVRSLVDEYRVQEIRVADGCWDLCGDASDVAVMILQGASDIEPVPVSFTHPRDLVAQISTAVGYGETPSGGSGTKYITQKEVTSVMRGLVFIEPAVCSGDSGGPLIGPDGMIYGVASFIYSPDGSSSPRCGTAPGAYNAIADHRALIEGAIEDSGTCLADGPEQCDGGDNDCDGMIDEDCTPIGQPCSDGSECVGGRCDDTPVGRVCTEACDPLDPALSCGIGLYCARTTGCDGLCVARTDPPGGMALGNGVDCSTDSECASLSCADPGDGRRRCLAPCRGDAGMCLSGEACAAPAGACGGCVPAEIIGELRGLGEPCDDATDCASGACFDDDGIEYCSRTCTADAECGELFHCRAGTCARGTRGGIGAGCVTNDDCSAGICATRGMVSWCTAFCPAAECPMGFDCVSVGDGSICAPAAGLSGETCMVAEDCVSGLCVDPGRGLVCTELCGPERACPAGFECVRTSDGVNNVCVAPMPPPPPDEGGCAVSAGRDPRPLGAAVMLGGAIVVWLARRRRRR